MIKYHFFCCVAYECCHFEQIALHLKNMQKYDIPELYECATKTTIIANDFVEMFYFFYLS